MTAGQLVGDDVGKQDDAYTVVTGEQLVAADIEEQEEHVEA